MMVDPPRKKRIPPLLVAEIRKMPNGTYEKRVPASTVKAWTEWRPIPAYMSIEEFVATCDEMGIEVKWTAL